MEAASDVPQAASDVTASGPASLGHRLRSLSADDAFAWMIAPVSPEEFFRDYWEKKPLHISRQQPDYYEGLFEEAAITKQLKTKSGLRYEQEINLARCVDGKQVMKNGTAGTKAQHDDVQRKVKEGCSVQVVHPQRFVRTLATLLAKLEGRFGTLWGANSFRTPPDSRGFKAHHDEVEVFMLQVGGAKSWRLNDCPSGALPRKYCWSYDEAALGPPSLDAIVRAGDLLYMPRGTVHRGDAVAGEFSHHITVSTYQRTSWADFLAKALPTMIDNASMQDASFRSGLPLRYLELLGEHTRPADQGSEEPAPKRQAVMDVRQQNRREFLKTLGDFVHRLADHAVDAADTSGDFFAAQFVARRLPPKLAVGIADDVGPYGPNPEDFQTLQGGEKQLQVRWRDPSAMRVVAEERAPQDGEPVGVTELQIYHSHDNKMSQHMREEEPEPGCLVLDDDVMSPVLRMLGARYPEWVIVADLPKVASESNGEGTETSSSTTLPWELVGCLWERGLLETRKAGDELAAVADVHPPRKVPSNPKKAFGKRGIKRRPQSAKQKLSKAD
eukprot:TRINITY_DN70915_c0_g1_i1.p1 TRINITY_DN70915_c0_g1~~TRINITY_DN70915_c0_g1_i1.p1  ORF type:complete len:556 (-),score=97.69 TRINITY_DN70915_c0_g1_i1:199-1866(-)